MHLRRRDLLLAAGLTLVIGSGANARILVESDPFVFPPLSKPRRLNLRNAHTGETFDGPYRDAIGPIPAAMIDLAILLRDHRENVTGPMFVETLDFLADVIENAGQSRATILSAFRTKKTNDMLRSSMFGVAEKSQHLAGRALDITLDSNLSSAAQIARKMTRGGVGWYPRSHFIHLDSGPVRSWTIDYRDNDSENYLLAAKPTGPLSVKDRLRLQRALAKRQLRGRIHTFKPAKAKS